VQGEVHFSAKQIRADKFGAVTRYRDRHYAAPALVPVMKQLPSAPPGAPALTGVRKSGKALNFDAQAGTGPAAASWALYRVGGSTAALVATGRTGSQVSDPAPVAGAAVYCLSGLDRSGNQGQIGAPFTAAL
jgi:anti-sigma factor RsiW